MMVGKQAQEESVGASGAWAGTEGHQIREILARKQRLPQSVQSAALS